MPSRSASLLTIVLTLLPIACDPEDGPHLGSSADPAPASRTGSSSSGAPVDREGSTDASNSTDDTRPVEAAPSSRVTKRLQLSLEEGETILREAETEIVVKEKLGEADRLTGQTLLLVTRERVESVERSDSGSEYLVDVRFERVRYEVTAGQTTFRFDSTEEGSDPAPSAAAPFAAIAGRSFRKRLSSTGRVVAIEGAEVLINAALEALSPSDEGARASFLRALRTQFDTEALLSMEQRAAVVFAADPVGTGDTWRQRVAVETGLPSITETEYRIERFDETEAVVSIQSSVQPFRPYSGDAIEAGSVELAGRRRGEARVDATRGVVVSSYLDEELSGSRRTPRLDGSLQDGALSIRTTTRTSARFATSSQP